MTIEAVEIEAPMPASGSLSLPEQSETGEEDSSAAGAKRWRGRRRRRGGRGGTNQQENESASSGTPVTYSDEIPATESEVAPQIHATGVPAERSTPRELPAEPTPRFERAAASTPFVLPGESLSKYGGAPADDTPTENVTRAAALPVRPSSSFKPASLIETPIQWDGSGLLPGESLARRSSRQSEPAQHAEAGLAVEVHAEPEGVVADKQEVSATAPDAVEEQEFFEEVSEAGPKSVAEFVSGPEIGPAETLLAPETEEDDQVEEEALDEDEYEETSETVLESFREARMPEEEIAETTNESADSEAGSTEPEPNATASHNVDPLPPSGFRFLGFGKKKTEEPAKAAVKSASSYAPGSGLIEEETIEEEEFDAPRHQHRAKGGDQDLDDLEEETLPTHLRTGDLGEMLQEAHLDHRIQLNFDEKNGDEEEIDEDEETPSTQGRPASGQQRPDRNARGRRPRGGSAAPATQAGRGRGMSRRSAQTSDLPIISDLLKPGQEILVQIAKEPIAKKGARITSHIALPGRFLVFMPTVSHIGVSRKIASDEERQRLKRVLVHERGEASGGFIVRTAAEGASEEELRADLRFLLHLWAEIKQRSDDSQSPALIYHDLSLIERILRDQVSSNFSSIWVDSQENYERIVRFLNRFSPTLVRRVKLYTKETPLFEHFGIQDEITKALNSKVWLKSGGSIVINQTEALVAIDINTGKYVGKSARLEDTIVKTNLDAVPEIVRQIRLRDLGGIIVIDFIDMDDRKNRFKVMAALEEALKSDRAPTKVLQFNDFGLVAITRKRVKQSLERTLSVPCPTCHATGMVKSPTTVCNEIYTEMRKMKKHFEGTDVLLRVNPETVKVLKSNNASWLTELEELSGKNILVKSDATLHPEQFDIQG